MPDQSNRTAVLNEIAFRARRSWRKTGEEYMEAAAALVEARDLCEHGEWGPWLAKTGIPERTAQRMIRIARADIKPATVADLGVGRVDEMLGMFGDIPEGLSGGTLVEMAEYLIFPVQDIYRWAHDAYSRHGAPVDVLESARPETLDEFLHWAKWAGTCPGKADPEAWRAWLRAAPWLPGNLAPEPEPIAA